MKKGTINSLKSVWANHHFLDGLFYRHATASRRAVQNTESQSGRTNENRLKWIVCFCKTSHATVPRCAGPELAPVWLRAAVRWTVAVRRGVRLRARHSVNDGGRVGQTRLLVENAVDGCDVAFASEEVSRLKTQFSGVTADVTQTRRGNKESDLGRVEHRRRLVCCHTQTLSRGRSISRSGPDVKKTVGILEDEKR
jgi:hypothetical protein